jgi:hypothetical protein
MSLRNTVVANQRSGTDGQCGLHIRSFYSFSLLCKERLICTINKEISLRVANSIQWIGVKHCVSPQRTVNCVLEMNNFSLLSLGVCFRI